MTKKPETQRPMKIDLNIHENAKLPKPKRLEKAEQEIAALHKELIKLSGWNAMFNPLSVKLVEASSALSQAQGRIKEAIQMVEDATETP
jgi:hypothetical protein